MGNWSIYSLEGSGYTVKKKKATKQHAESRTQKAEEEIQWFSSWE